MFHRIVVLTDGKVTCKNHGFCHVISLMAVRQVAYHGVPEKAYEVFVDALHSAFLSQGVKIPPVEDHNPAGSSQPTLRWPTVSNYSFSDIIMDMLGDRKMREIVSKYYENSGEPQLIRKAVDEARKKEQKHVYSEVDGQQGTLPAKMKALR